MQALDDLPLVVLFVVFGAAAVAIAVIGTRFTAIVDTLADRTHLGEAISGAVFLGATTSLPDIIVSCTAAAEGRADFAMSNAVGGIAAQTAFLAVADITYRKANLEHAAASVRNMLQATVLISILAVVLIAMSTPTVEIWNVNIASGIIIAMYIAALKLTSSHLDGSAWIPKQTPETVTDVPAQANREVSARHIWLRFGVAALLVACAGLVVAETGTRIADRTQISDSAVGAVFTGVATSSGELVTSIAAVRRGALTLAVAGIIGGNSFDALLIPASDFAYREGSIYHAAGDQSVVLVGVTILMTSIILMGLLARQKQGVGRIGFESALILLLYGGVVAYLFTAE